MATRRSRRRPFVLVLVVGVVVVLLLLLAVLSRSARGDALPEDALLVPAHWWDAPRLPPGGRGERFVPHVGVSASQQFIVVCSRTRTPRADATTTTTTTVARADFFRVLMYPNLYPHRTHLFYGSLDLLHAFPQPSANDSSARTLLACAFAPDQSVLFALWRVAAGRSGADGAPPSAPRRFHLETTSHFWLEYARPVRTGADARAVAETTGFSIVHPRDAYRDVWSVRRDAGRPRAVFRFETDDAVREGEGAAAAALAAALDAQRVPAAAAAPDDGDDGSDEQDAGIVVVAGRPGDGALVAAAVVGHTTGVIVWGADTRGGAPRVEWIRADGGCGAFVPASAGFSAVSAAAAEAPGVGTLRLAVRCAAPSTDLLRVWTLAAPEAVAAAWTPSHLALPADAPPPPVPVLFPPPAPAPGCPLTSSVPEVPPVVSPPATLLAAASSDGRVVALSNVSTSRVCLWEHAHGRGTARPTTATMACADVDGVPVSLGVYHFDRYFVVAATDAGVLHVAATARPSVPRCDARARVASFYLPAPPLDGDGDADAGADAGADAAAAVQRQGRLGLLSEPGLLAGWALAFTVLLALAPRVTALERHLLWQRCPTVPARVWTAVFVVSWGGVLLFSAYELAFEPAFVNDWPAHLHHVDDVVSRGILDYGRIMHYHGPCTYPGGFVALYALLRAVTGGSLRAFQAIWAVLEIAMFVVLRAIIVLEARLPPLLALLPVFSNRLHLYNVRVVVNDLPPVFLMHAAVYLLLRRRRVAASLCFALALANKLNFVFYGPALALVLWLDAGFAAMLRHGALVAFVQVLAGLPFLWANPRAYVDIAYDVGRTFLWEKTRSFKWVGRAVFDAPAFHRTLLAATAGVALWFAGKVVAAWWARRRAAREEAPRLRRHRRQRSAAAAAAPVLHGLSPAEIVHLMFFTNFVSVAFARGLYTPFISWYFYTFPLVAHLAGLPVTYVVAAWGAHEALFRFFPDNLRFEMLASYIWFLTNMLVVAATLLRPLASRRREKGD